VRPRCHQSIYLSIKLIYESALFFVSRSAARSYFLSFGCASIRRRAHELARSMVCIMSFCLLLVSVRKLVHACCTLFSDTAEPDHMSMPC